MTFPWLSNPSNSLSLGTSLSSPKYMLFILVSYKDARCEIFPQLLKPSISVFCFSSDSSIVDLPNTALRSVTFPWLSNPSSFSSGLYSSIVDLPKAALLSITFPWLSNPSNSFPSGLELSIVDLPKAALLSITFPWLSNPSKISFPSYLESSVVDLPNTALLSITFPWFLNPFDSFSSDTLLVPSSDVSLSSSDVLLLSSSDPDFNLLCSVDLGILSCWVLFGTVSFSDSTPGIERFVGISTSSLWVLGGSAGTAEQSICS